jgi:predicted HTH transcriptional regulator
MMEKSYIELIKEIVKNNGPISRIEIQQKLLINKSSIIYSLNKLLNDETISKIGNNKSTKYIYNVSALIKNIDVNLYFSDL